MSSPFSAEGTGLIPGKELRPQMPCGQKKQNIKQKQYSNQVSKDFKNGPHQKKIFKIVKKKKKCTIPRILEYLVLQPLL